MILRDWHLRTAWFQLQRLTKSQTDVIASKKTPIQKVFPKTSVDFISSAKFHVTVQLVSDIDVDFSCTFSVSQWDAFCWKAKERKLHSARLLPLLMWLFRWFRWQMLVHQHTWLSVVGKYCTCICVTRSSLYASSDEQSETTRSFVDRSRKSHSVQLL